MPKKAEQDYCANKQDQTTQMAKDRLLYDSNGDLLFMSPKWIHETANEPFCQKFFKDDALSE